MLQIALAVHRLHAIMLQAALAVQTLHTTHATNATQDQMFGAQRTALFKAQTGRKKAVSLEEQHDCERKRKRCLSKDITIVTVNIVYCRMCPTS